MTKSTINTNLLRCDLKTNKNRQKQAIEPIELTPMQKRLLNLNRAGTQKLFTPVQLLQNVTLYIQHCKDNPIQSSQLLTGGQKAGTVTVVDKPRMLTIEGFCLFCGVNTKYLNELNEQVKDKEDEISIQYSYIIRYIYDVIRCQRLELAAANELNALIVSRIENLNEKIEHSGEVKQTITQINFIQRSVEDTTYKEVSEMIENL